jgi:hypothetical protein
VLQAGAGWDFLKREVQLTLETMRVQWIRVTSPRLIATWLPVWLGSEKNRSFALAMVELFDRYKVPRWKNAESEWLEVESESCISLLDICG